MKHLYDADKKRTVKLSGNNEAVYVNTIPSANETQTDRFTIYPNPYMVFTNGGRYTKHIYIGSERIVSKVAIDNGYDPRTAQTAAYGNNSYVTKLNNQSAALNDSVEAIYTKFQLPFNGLNNDDIIQGFQPALRSMVSTTSSSTDNYEEYSYYIHSDHLGSSSYITDTGGEVSQHVEYVPFGEVFIEELSSSAKLNTPFLFNGKELDEETGLYYYGARYYEPRTSLWLSTDPLELKYPNVSTYAYCLNSPISAIDYNGADLIYVNNQNQITKVVADGKDDITLTFLNGQKIAFSDIKFQVSNWLFFGDKNSDNRQLVANVVGYYANKMGISKVGASGSSRGNNVTMFFSNKENLILLNPTLDGTCHDAMGNKHNLMNAIYHEGLHQINKKNNIIENHYTHAKLVLETSLHSSYSNCTEEYKTGQMGYFAQLIMNAYYNGYQQESLQLITDYNKANLGTTMMFDINNKKMRFSNGKNLKYKEAKHSINL